MGKKHVKKHVKKALAFSLATAMAIPSISLLDSNSASAADMPTPVVVMDFERGFAGSGVDQAKVGEVIAFLEKKDDRGNIRDANGDETGEMVMGNTVLVQGSWKSGAGYSKATIPAGMPRQMEPDFSTNDGTYFTYSAGNQPTTAYDENTYNPDGSVATYGKGNVFWLDDTREYPSYPTYATTVDYENGTWTTNMDLIVKDTKGIYQEFEIDNSAAEFNNPFVGANATGFTLASWIKNTKKYKAPVVYGNMGDLNGSGGIDPDDALAILMHLAGKQTLSETGQLFADVDGKSGVTPDDALMILQVIAGKISDSAFAPAPDIGGATEQEVPLENTEFFHIEDRTTGKDLEANGTVRDVRERQYLYFAADGVTYVGDFKDAETVCTWKVPEDKLTGEGGLLNAKNGGKWNYISYSFDGTDFTMYVNGEKVELTKTAGANYNNDILSFVSSKGAKTYLGGLGGGVKGNFNTYAIKTSDDYYMDDIAVYTSALSAEQSAQAYTDAETAKTAVENTKAQKIKTYDFEGGSSLAANGLVKVSGASDEYVPEIAAERDGKVLQVKKSYESMTGGLQLRENPFAGQSDLTGVTISYWMRPIPNKRGVVTDGVLLSFLDDAKECVHEKVGENYLGANAIARSQLYFNVGYIGQFIEGATKPIGTKSLKNIYTFKPYRYGDEPELPAGDYHIPWDKGTYNEWKTFRNNLGTKWSFVTITINNAGFKMYIDGEEVENKLVDFKGETFYDSYWFRVGDAFKKGTNNANARCLMDFITDPTLKVYIGFAYVASSDTNYLPAADCYLDDLSFYDKDMNKAEVKALYESTKIFAAYEETVEVTKRSSLAEK